MIQLSDLNLDKMSPTELGELLIEAKKAYYTGGKPIMDDHTYDTLEDILRQQNPHHRLFQKIGTPNFDTGWPKAKHLSPMFSQNKVSSYQNLIKYFDLKNIPSDTDYITQPKCDGLSVELIYQNGQIKQAITRGDGKVGDLITQNVIKMKGFLSPLKLKFSGSVRAEIVVTFADFKRLNRISSDDYSNPRNAASGISQRLDSQYADYCTLIPVDLLDPNHQPQTELKQVEKIQSLGLQPVETHHHQNLSQVESLYQQFLNTKRENYPFDIDGLVIKINSVSLQQQLGSLNNRPKFQVAYKFPAAASTSTIKAINWQTGPLGTVTPVAQIDPIQLAGATISSVSLGNYNLLLQKNINTDDVVQVSRRGDVIPYVEKVVTKVTPGSATIPDRCPSCHHLLKKADKYLKCPNQKFCPAQTLGSLNIFTKVLDIKGISSKTIKKLVKANLVKLPGDFYQLTVDDIAPLEGLGQKSAQNIVNQIQNKKQISLAQALSAAAIPHFSQKRILQLISAGFNTPQKILNLTQTDLQNLPGFQQTLAKKVITGLESKKPAIKSILDQIKLKSSTSSSQLAGQKFAITGSLSQPRQQIEQQIQQAGGQVVSQVTSNTDYLVANQKSDSSKYQNAIKLDIPIISESKLKQILS